MKKKGVLLTCDRCGTAVMLEEDVSSGILEDDPKGWEHRNAKDLCPDCCKKYEEVVARFWAGSGKNRAHF